MRDQGATKRHQAAVWLRGKPRADRGKDRAGQAGRRGIWGFSALPSSHCRSAEQLCTPASAHAWEQFCAQGMLRLASGSPERAAATGPSLLGAGGKCRTSGTASPSSCTKPTLQNLPRTGTQTPQLLLPCTQSQLEQSSTPCPGIPPAPLHSQTMPCLYQHPAQTLQDGLGKGLQTDFGLGQGVFWD